jgi:mono/diheme cytochrome c family protein
LLALAFSLLGSPPCVCQAQSADPVGLLDSLLLSIERAEIPTDRLLSTLQQAPISEGAADLSAGEDFFESRIRPVLIENCIGCHGPDKQKAGLRLDSAQALAAGGEGGPILDPANSENSRLLKVLHYDSDPQMPPAGKLDDRVIRDFQEWLALGAPWPSSDKGSVSGNAEGPSFEERLRKAKQDHWAFKPVGAPAIPQVENPDWVRTPVDAFILDSLSKAGLRPSESSDKRTLIRRVAFDLTGLPPTMEEVENFVQDESPNAYEELVERLLASPRYGERWGRHWLDIARYSDTKGYVFNQERRFAFSHTYRDYVIRAFNEDLPYDRFLIEQLAADKLELGEDKRPLAAMGYLTLGRRFINNIHDITDDRIDVVTRGMLGLTVSCARCHEHKYDPIPTEDYYSLYGIFRSGEMPDELPQIEDPDPEDPQYQEYLKGLADKDGIIEAYLDEQHEKILRDGRVRLGDYLQAAADIWNVTDNEVSRTLAAERELNWRLILDWKKFLEARIGEEAYHPLYGPLRAIATIPEASWSAKSRESVERIGWHEEEPFTQTNPLLAAQILADATELSDPTHAASLPERLKPLLALYADLFERAEEEWKELLANQAQKAVQNGSQEILLPAALADAGLEEIRGTLLATDSPMQVPRSNIESYFDRELRNPLTEKRNDRALFMATHPGRPDHAMVYADNPNPFDPYVFKRGKPENRGESIPRRFLAVLSSENRPIYKTGSGRLEMAQAIASATNPLTARVWVNRVWMHHFGNPLVATPSDFGLRSEAPTHPELLDHLAARFMAEGWSTKDLHRWIVLSSTYRQSSFSNPEGRAKDPANRLLWRQNRRRLDFESMRDSYLLVAGALDLAMGGESVPTFTEPFTPRRSVYGFIERQNLPGLLRTFDFPSPDAHSPQRFRTTVPQQALYLLNSPFLLNQSHQLAANSCAQPDSTPEDRVVNLYEKAYQRTPSPEEVHLGVGFVQALGDPPAPSQTLHPDWEYGYAAIESVTGPLVSFTHYPFFGENAWKGGPTIPDASLGWTTVNPTGGHPGKNSNFCSVRRWTAPVAGTYSIRSTLEHKSAEGDGVFGSLLKNADSLLWHAAAHNSSADGNLQEVELEAGDTLDFVVACGQGEGYDSYGWSPVIALIQTESDYPGTREWNAANDFQGPPPAQVGPWTQYAQALLVSNEFLFVD